MIKLVPWLLLIVVLTVVGPFISIWALNTLFKVGIEYSVWSWLAVMWLQLIFVAKISKS